MKISDYRSSLAAKNGGVDPYADLTDQEFAASLHQRHYKDLPFEQFASTVGLQGNYAPAGPRTRPRTDPSLNTPTIDGVEQPRFAMGQIPTDPRIDAAVGEMGPEDPSLQRALARLPSVIPAAGKHLERAGLGLRRGAVDVVASGEVAVADRRAELESTGALQTDEPTGFFQSPGEIARGAAQETLRGEFGRGASERAGQAELQSARLGRRERQAAAEAAALEPSDAGPIERSVRQGLTSALVTAPIVTAGALIPGGQVPALVALGGMTGAQRYGELRAAGIPEGAAALSSAYLGSLEGLTERFPLGAIAKNSPIIRQAAEFLVTDILGENINTAAQIIDDYRLGLRDDVTVADLQQALQETTGATIVGAGATLTMAELTRIVINGANQAASSREPTIEAPPVEAEMPTFGDESMQVDVGEDITLEGDGTVQPAFPEVDPATTQVEEGVPGEEITIEGDQEMLPGEIRVDELPGEDVTLETDPMQEFQRADEELATDEELADVEIEEPGTGPPAAVLGSRGTEPEKPTMAQRRELMKAKHLAVEANIRPDTKPRDITYVQSPDGLHGVAISGTPVAWYGQEELARKEIKAVRSDILTKATQKPAEARAAKPSPSAKPKPAAAATVLGQAVEPPAAPTEGQKSSGKYFKPIVHWQDMPIRIENLKDSVREGPRDDDGQPAWRSKMKANYGYIQGSKATDKEGVDVYIGEDQESKRAFVIDQLTKDGKRFDEPKVVIGVPDEAAARKLYLDHYPAGWKGLGAITEMDPDALATWAYSEAAKRPVAWKTGQKPSKLAKPESIDPRVTTRADQLRHMASRAGWQEVGGRGIVEGDATKVEYVGRTKWLPYEEWFADVQREAKLEGNKAGKATAEAVRKATAGEALTAAEARHIKAMLDRIDADEREVAQLAGQFDEQQAGGMSDAELAALEAKITRLYAQGGQTGTADEPMFSRKDITSGDLFGGELPDAPKPAAKSPKAQQTDLFGAPNEVQQLLAKVRAEKERRRNQGQESVETGRADDMFSQASKQIDVEDKAAKPKAKPEAPRADNEFDLKHLLVTAYSRLDNANRELYERNVQGEKRQVYERIAGEAETAIRNLEPRWFAITGEHFGLLGGPAAKAKSDLDKPKPASKVGADVRSASQPAERARQDRDAPVSVEQPSLFPEPAAEAGAPGPAGRLAGKARDPGEGRPAVPGDRPATGGERGNLSFFDQEGRFADPPGAAGDNDAAASPGSGRDAVADDRQREAEAVEAAEAARPRLDHTAKLRLQQQAESIPVTLADADNIAATLPYLLPSQHEDVLTAERRFAKPDGYGIVFTNGTGTGKTYLGLGIAKRFAKRGKGRGLIVVPSQKLAEDWTRAGKNLGLHLLTLDSTKDPGRGIAITTYANFAENRTLADRDYDFVMMDEAQGLMQNEAADPTGALYALRAVTNHPAGAYDRAAMRHRVEYDAWQDAQAKSHAKEKEIRQFERAGDDASAGNARTELALIEQRATVAQGRWEEKLEAVREQVKAAQGADRTRALFLSATPFAYEKNVKWGEGYLFEFPEPEGRGYNTPDGFGQFMMTHFGYRMRTGKLTEPEAEIDRDLMQRQFNSHLRKQGVLSARLLEVDADYDRKFVFVESKIGNKIDEGLNWLRDNKRMWPIYQIINKRFDYLARSRLLQSLKAVEAVEYIQAQHALGRKVVVFYDYNEGGSHDVFKIPDMGELATVQVDGEAVPLRALVDEYREARPDLWDLDTTAPNPLETLKAAFPQAREYNGRVPPKQRTKFVDAFNDDTLPESNLILAQKAANAGWSAHDTTGKHQRVLINLGLPTAPVTAIQQEGRIFRVGNVSDAVFRYFNTGTSWERIAFAGTIARRAATAENLAMGEQARGLKDAFITAFEAADVELPGPDDGKGGKAADRAMVQALSAFDRARALYFATEKKTSRTKSREGADYFATPEPLGYMMVQWGTRGRPGQKYLEPSAGHGAIARWFPDNTERHVVEPSMELASRLALASDAKLHMQQFEDYNIVNKFDVIVMNPPFGHGGSTAIKHLDKATKHLNDGGRVVALIPEGSAANKAFDKWYEAVEGVYLVREFGLPTVAFERAGTAVKTRVVILDKLSKKAQEAGARLEEKGRIDIDADNIKDFFDAIEGREAPERPQLSAAQAIEQQIAGEVAVTPAAAGTPGIMRARTFQHTKTGANMHVAEMTERVPPEKYQQYLTAARKLGGYWNRYVVPGFAFKTAEQRDAYVNAINGTANLRLTVPAGGMPAAVVREEANRFLGKFKTRPNVVVVQSFEELADDVQAAVRRAGSEGIEDKVDAFHLGGTLYFVANKVGSSAIIPEKLLHEFVGHYGLRSMLDVDERNEILDGIARDMPMPTRRYGRAYYGDKFDMNNAVHRRRSAEEVIAYFGERYLRDQSVPAKLKRWLDRVIAAIRDFLRNTLGLGPRFDERFVRVLLQDLQRHLMRGGDTIVASSTAEASTQAPVFYSAVARAVDNIGIKKAGAEQWMNTLRNVPGVKPEELEWLGIDEWLKSLGRPATRDEVASFVAANQIQVRDALKGDAGGKTSEIDRMIVELSALGYEPVYPYADDSAVLTGIQNIRTGRTSEYSATGQLGEHDSAHKFTAHEIPEEVFKLVQELVAAQSARIDDEDGYGAQSTKYQQYTLPGGENYRELLLTLPRKRDNAAFAEFVAGEGYAAENGRITDAATDEVERLERDFDARQPSSLFFRSGHWDEKNILAHVRFNERTDADGKRVLFIEEIQSDWHQAGRRRGYQKAKPTDEDVRQFFDLDPSVWTTIDQTQRDAYREDMVTGIANRTYRGKDLGVPDAPFKTTWPELAFKRMLRWAAENGFERIAWTTGQQQNERYGLEQHLGAVEWFDYADNGRGLLVAYSQQGGHLWEREINRSEIGEYIGDEVAERLRTAPSTRDRNRHYRIEGNDLRSGGAGMRGFYDDILPKTVNKLVKRWGGKVSTANVITDVDPRRFEGVTDSGFSVGRYATEAEAQIQINRLGTGGRVGPAALKNEKVHSIDVTPAMRDAALEGLPMFSRTDVMERKVPKGTEEARGYAKLANTVIDVWNRKVGRFYGPLGSLPEAKKYLIERYRTLGGLSHVREVSRGVFDALSNATPEDAQRIYTYLTSAGALPDDIEDSAVRNVAISTKQAIDVQGRALVEAGLLSEESYETYRDQYLPRLYLRHILGDKTGGRMMGSGKKLSDMGYLKQRKDIPEEVRKVILGEITDPAFLAAFGLSRTMRDLTIMNFLQSISQNKAWAPQIMLIDWDGRKVSPFWLQSEAKQLRKQADHIKHKLTADKARAIADRMDSLANRSLEELGALDLSEFKQIPDSGRYGALRGLYVRKEIHEDLVGAHQFVESDSLLENIFGQGGALTKVTRAWKTSKVALNVPSHFRNNMGNAIMLHLSGVPLARLPQRVVQALNSVIAKDEWYQIAQKYGLKEATFANTELYRIRDEWMLLQRSKQPTVNHLHALFAQITTKVGDVYQFEEALFKIAKLRDAMEREGMGEADAMIEAHKWIFDYSLVPRWVRYLRNAPFGIPFLSYSYFALPRLAETLVKRPWKFLPYVMVTYAIQQAIMNMYGADDDELDKLKGAFPEWMKSRGGMLLQPWKDQEGRWQVVDLGYTVPWGQLLDTMASAREGNFRQSAETMGLFSGPLPDLVAAWQTNKDPFTGREIANSADPTWKRVQSVLAYAYNMAMPGFVTGTGAGGKIIDAHTGRVDPRSGEPTLTKTQAWLRLFGVSVYPIDPEVTRARNLRSMAFEIDEVRKRMGSQLRDRNLTDEQKQEVRRVYQEEIKLRVDKMRKYQEESEIPDNLRRERPDDLIGRVAPLIDGKSKPEVVRSLRDAGYPALAALFEELPAKPKRAALAALQEGSSAAA